MGIPWTELDKFAEDLDTHRKSHLAALSEHQAILLSDLAILARTLACQMHTKHLRSEIHKFRLSRTEK